MEKGIASQARNDGPLTTDSFQPSLRGKLIVPEHSKIITSNAYEQVEDISQVGIEKIETVKPYTQAHP